MEALLPFISALVAVLVAQQLISTREQLKFKAEKVEDLGRQLIDANQQVLNFYTAMSKKIDEGEFLNNSTAYEFNNQICAARDNAVLTAQLFIPEVAPYVLAWADVLSAYQGVLISICGNNQVPDIASPLREEQVEKYHAVFRELKAVAVRLNSNTAMRVFRLLSGEHK